MKFQMVKVPFIYRLLFLFTGKMYHQTSVEIDEEGKAVGAFTTISILKPHEAEEVQ